MNDNEVAANLDEFIKSGLSNYLKTAMSDACALVRNDAIERAPGPNSTGALRNSIHFDVEEDGTEGVVYSNAEYAPYVEIGTGLYSSKGTGRKDVPWKYKGPKGWVTTYGNKPQPFLEPAVNANKSDIFDRFEGLF
jgi:HK97 gp10 family phage protein